MSTAQVVVTASTVEIHAVQPVVAFGEPMDIEHNALLERDEDDAHPIGSITGLQPELDDLQEQIDEIGVTAHNDLTGRDAADAHPIDSITGLTAALAGKQASNANLTALAGLTGAADTLSYFTGVGAMATAALTAFGRSLIACATAGAALTALGAEASANKGIANGYASLDGTGKIPSAQLPAIAITDTFVVASQVAMLALTAQTGDVAVRSDLNKSYILAGSDPTILGNWQELLTPTDTVLSVNGFTGAVTIGASDLTTGTLAAARGGTGVSNTGTLTNASNTTITGGGTIALAGFTLTVPATGTAALIAASNAFTGANTFTNASGITTLQAATQDAIRLLGRAGGSGSYIASITPPTLSASRTWTGVDASDTFAFLGQAQTFTAAQTIDLGTGALPAAVNGAYAFRVAQADTTANVWETFGYAGTALVLRGRAASGTRSAPTASADGLRFFQMAGHGYDGSAWYSAPNSTYIQSANGLWSGSNRGTTHLWTATLNGATSPTGGLYFQGTTTTDPFPTLGIGAAPTAGNGLLQLASGTTKAYGIAWGTDTFLFRSAAGVLKHNSAQFIGSTTTMTNGAAAAAGTLLNAPAAGNPTKWIPIDDNGTTRYIPAW